MRRLLAALSGALFGLGLMVSGMTDTTRVQGWLDLFGDWDPTLAFVLGGALIPMAVAWAWVTPRGASLLGTPLPARPKPEVDRPLVWGAAIFGVGWALAGLCPGPAMASLAYGERPGVIFLAAMVVGMALTPRIRARLPALGAA